MGKPAFLWGTTSSGGTAYGKTLLLGYPLYDIVTDREPRKGSEWVQAPSGLEDAWVTGYDYTLAATVKFIPDTTSASPTRAAVAGSVTAAAEWQSFLDYARLKYPFRFCPVATCSGSYVDGCYLVDPMTGFGSNMENLQRQVPIKIRNPNVDFTRAAVLGLTSS